MTSHREQFKLLRVPKVDSRILRREQPEQLRGLFYLFCIGNLCILGPALLAVQTNLNVLGKR